MHMCTEGRTAAGVSAVAASTVHVQPAAGVGASYPGPRTARGGGGAAAAATAAEEEKGSRGNAHGVGHGG